MLFAHLKILSLPKLGFYSLMVLAFSLPFEIALPWIRWGAFRLTNLEILLALTLGLAFLTVWRTRKGVDESRHRLPAAWLGLWLLLVLALMATAVLAPELQQNAIKAAVRMIGGMGLALAAWQLVRSEAQLSCIAATLVAGGLLSIGVGAAERLHGNIITSWLELFRPGPTLVGPFIRLTGSFNHANQAAMFTEAMLPLTVVLLLTAWAARRRLPAVLFMIALLLQMEGLLLTYSRAGLATLVVASLATAGLLWQGKALHGRQAAYPWLGLAGLLLIFIIMHTWLNPVFKMRLLSEDDRDWYQAHLRAPEQLETMAGTTKMIAIYLRNDGSLTWPNAGQHPVRIGGRWYREADNKRLATEPRWRLDTPVAPGEEMQVAVSLKSPQTPGFYRLEWDLVQENIAWFSQKNGVWVDSEVSVMPAPPDLFDSYPESEIFFTPEPYIPPIPRRLTLWQIAGQMLLAHPWLGIGLDNFRWTYGRFLNLSYWDDTIHTNNWYLETVVSLGIMGSLPFFAWLLLLLRDLVRTLRQSSATLWQMGLAAGLFAYFIHGWLDYFLMVHATGLLFWLLVGLWAAHRNDPGEERR